MHVNEHGEEELNSVGLRALAKLFTAVSHRKLPTVLRLAAQGRVSTYGEQLVSLRNRTRPQKSRG
jgi:hypothetical protein